MSEGETSPSAVTQQPPQEAAQASAVAVPPAPPPSYADVVKEEEAPQLAYPGQQQVFLQPLIADVQKAPHSAPSTFLIFTLCVVIICMLLNLSNFVLAVPAMVLAFMSKYYINEGNYVSAAKFGRAAFIINIVIILYTLIFAVIGTAIGVWYYSTYQCMRVYFSLEEGYVCN